MLIVGTSGWQYRDWKGPFYPPGAAQLPYYASHFSTVELNNSFYRLPPRETFAKWRAETPDGFVFAVKVSRYLTHIKRLRDPEEPVARFLGAVEPRHASWWCDTARDLLEKHGAALCWADRLWRPITPLWHTAGFGYVRLHEGRAQPRPRYGRAALASWLRRISGFGDEPVWVYFNNDPGCAAVFDAFALRKLAG